MDTGFSCEIQYPAQLIRSWGCLSCLNAGVYKIGNVLKVHTFFDVAFILEAEIFVKNGFQISDFW